MYPVPTCFVRREELDEFPGMTGGVFVLAQNGHLPFFLAVGSMICRLPKGPFRVEQ
jgi:hypothetical protein